MIRKNPYVAPETESLVVIPEEMLLASPGEVNENGTEIGTVIESGWDEWNN